MGHGEDAHESRRPGRVISRRYRLVLPRNSRRHLRLDCHCDPDVLVREHISGAPLRWITSPSPEAVQPSLALHAPTSTMTTAHPGLLVLAGTGGSLPRRPTPADPFRCATVCGARCEIDVSLKSPCDRQFPFSMVQRHATDSMPLLLEIEHPPCPSNQCAVGTFLPPRSPERKAKGESSW
jgi:hypothetical protein